MSDGRVIRVFVFVWCGLCVEGILVIVGMDVSKRILGEMLWIEIKSWI